MEPKNVLVSEVIECQKALARAFHANATPNWLELDLTMPQLKTLFTLAEEGPVTIGQAAETLGISLPTASHLVDRLVHAGLAERAEDPADRRRTLARLSPRGEELVGQLYQGRQDRFRTWLGRLTEAELTCLLCGMQALLRTAQRDERPSSREARCGSRRITEPRRDAVGG